MVIVVTVKRNSHTLKVTSGSALALVHTHYHRRTLSYYNYFIIISDYTCTAENYLLFHSACLLKEFNFKAPAHLISFLSMCNCTQIQAEPKITAIALAITLHNNSNDSSADASVRL